MPIQASVGRGGANRRDDILLVQKYLNVARRQAGLPLVVVDGLIGPETIGAITAFQATHRGVVDGRVDPRGAAITELDRIASTAGEAQLRADLVQVLDGLAQRLDQWGTVLPADLTAKFGAIRSAVMRLQGGPVRPTNSSPTISTALYTSGPHRPMVLAVAPALAGGAVIVVQAMILTLIATMALLILIQAMPHISRAVEDLLRQIQVLMASIVDTINEAIEGIEDLIRRNTQAGMRCSQLVIAFREISRQIKAHITSPRPGDELGQRRWLKQLGDLFERWKAAMAALLECMTLHGAT